MLLVGERAIHIYKTDMIHSMCRRNRRLYKVSFDLAFVLLSLLLWLHARTGSVSAKQGLDQGVGVANVFILLP